MDAERRRTAVHLVWMAALSVILGLRSAATAQTTACDVAPMPLSWEVLREGAADDDAREIGPLEALYLEYLENCRTACFELSDREVIDIDDAEDAALLLRPSHEIERARRAYESARQRLDDRTTALLDQAIGGGMLAADRIAALRSAIERERSMPEIRRRLGARWPGALFDVERACTSLPLSEAERAALAPLLDGQRAQRAQLLKSLAQRCSRAFAAAARELEMAGFAAGPGGRLHRPGGSNADIERAWARVSAGIADAAADVVLGLWQHARALETALGPANQLRLRRAVIEGLLEGHAAVRSESCLMESAGVGAVGVEPDRRRRTLDAKAPLISRAIEALARARGELNVVLDDGAQLERRSEELVGALRALNALDAELATECLGAGDPAAAREAAVGGSAAKAPGTTGPPPLRFVVGRFESSRPRNSVLFQMCRDFCIDPTDAPPGDRPEESLRTIAVLDNHSLESWQEIEAFLSLDSTAIAPGLALPDAHRLLDRERAAFDAGWSKFEEQLFESTTDQPRDRAARLRKEMARFDALTTIASDLFGDPCEAFGRSWRVDLARAVLRLRRCSDESMLFAAGYYEAMLPLLERRMNCLLARRGAEIALRLGSHLRSAMSAQPEAWPKAEVERAMSDQRPQLERLAAAHAALRLAHRAVLEAQEGALAAVPDAGARGNAAIARLLAGARGSGTWPSYIERALADSGAEPGGRQRSESERAEALAELIAVASRLDSQRLHALIDRLGRPAWEEVGDDFAARRTVERADIALGSRLRWIEFEWTQRLAIHRAQKRPVNDHSP
ncbi:MAG: hypothetical protein U0625_00560 [Phycisphaerales bacterium]